MMLAPPSPRDSAALRRRLLRLSVRLWWRPCQETASFPRPRRTSTFWHYHRSTRSQTFPRLHGSWRARRSTWSPTASTGSPTTWGRIAVAARVNTLPGSSSASPATEAALTTRTGAAGAPRSP